MQWQAEQGLSSYASSHRRYPEKYLKQYSSLSSKKSCKSILGKKVLLWVPSSLFIFLGERQTCIASAFIFSAFTEILNPTRGNVRFLLESDFRVKHYAL